MLGGHVSHGASFGFGFGKPGADLRHIGRETVIMDRTEKHLPDRGHKGDQDKGPKVLKVEVEYV